MCENAQIEVPGWVGVGGGCERCSTRQATQGRGGFNRYRAFRRAVLWAMCCEQYAVRGSQHVNKYLLWPMGLVISGTVDAIWGLSWDDCGATWAIFGAILGYDGTILGNIWRS